MALQKSCFTIFQCILFSSLALRTLQAGELREHINFSAVPAKYSESSASYPGEINTHDDVVTGFLHGKTLKAGNHCVRTIDEIAVVILQAEDVHKATAAFNVWEPYVNTSDGGVYSVSRMSIFDPDNPEETIEAGWHVYPSLWGDNRVRFFVFYTLDLYKTLCYNFQCEGFVQEGRFYPGTILDASKYGQIQFETVISITKEFRGKYTVWAVYVFDELVGHWPASLFKYINETAKEVDFGGAVGFVRDCERSFHTKTHMGSGHFPHQSLQKAAFVRNFQLFDSVGRRISSFNNKEYYATNPQCYDIKGHSSTDELWRDYILYGGPGADAHSCVNRI